MDAAVRVSLGAQGAAVAGRTGCGRGGGRVQAAAAAVSAPAARVLLGDDDAVSVDGGGGGVVPAEADGAAAAAAPVAGAADDAAAAVAAATAEEEVATLVPPGVNDRGATGERVVSVHLATSVLQAGPDRLHSGLLSAEYLHEDRLELVAEDAVDEEVDGGVDAHQEVRDLCSKNAINKAD